MLVLIKINMQRGKNRTIVKEETTALKVVVVENDQARIEREIERNIERIRSLISKLRPSERQKYFDGLLSHLLSEPLELPVMKVSTKNKLNAQNDYSKLSVEELKLIEELSIKMEQLYRTMNYDPS
jgi:hypothetical protein